MECKHARQALLDREANGESSGRDPLESHLLGCPACRQLQDQLRKLEAAMEKLPVLEPGPRFNQVTWAKIAAGEQRDWMDRLPFSSWPSALRWGVAAGILVAFLVAISLSVFHPPTPPPTAVMTDSDLEDNQLLLELDALINTDERHFLSTYQAWEVPAEPPESNKEKPTEPEEKSQPSKRMDLDQRPEKGKIVDRSSIS